ncbi:MAG: hypothetical protein ACSHYB_04105 [Roseibacillus sp.]
MRILIALTGLGLLTLLLRRIPESTFLMFSSPSNRTFTLSRTGVSVGAKPQVFENNGINQLRPFVERLNTFSEEFQSVHIFTLDGERGLGLDSQDGVISVGFTVEWRQETEREDAIREFLKVRDYKPSSDYLAANGDVPDATRVLDYEIAGTTEELTELLRTLLQDIYGIQPNEAISVLYEPR